MATRTAQSCNNTPTLPHIRQAILGGGIHPATPIANGDIVIVPAGNCTWTVPLDFLGGPFPGSGESTLYQRRFTLRGVSATPSNITRATAESLCQAPGQTSYTCITDGVVKTSLVTNFIRWQTTDGAEVSRITGFTFFGNGLGSGGNDGLMQIRGNTSRFRFDRNSMYTRGNTGLHTWDYVRGVIDHNYFDISETGFAMYNFHHQWGNVGANGDNSWAAANTFGTSQALFFESNLVKNWKTHFTGANGNDPPHHKYCQDGWNGMRMVYRNNDFVNCTWADHGTESGGRVRSARQSEIYNNVFTWDMSDSTGPTHTYASLIGTRGGSHRVWGNRATITNGSVDAFMDLETQRVVEGHDPWGCLSDAECSRCNGSNTWDGNQGSGASIGYPCLDQVGRGSGDLLIGSQGSTNPINSVTGTGNGAAAGASWPHQASEPSYMWDNLLNGAPANIVSRRPNHITLNREYFVSTTKPAAMAGYTGYTFPHPIVTELDGGGTTPDTTPPATPTGFAVS